LGPRREPRPVGVRHGGRGRRAAARSGGRGRRADDVPAPAARRPRRGRALRPRAHPGGQLTAGKARLGRAWLRALSAWWLGGWVPLLGKGGWRCWHVSFAVLGQFRDAVSLIGDAS